jgi:hypothetical protein
MNISDAWNSSQKVPPPCFPAMSSYSQRSHDDTSIDSFLLLADAGWKGIVDSLVDDHALDWVCYTRAGFMHL